MNKIELAKENFKSGLNCTQSVVLAFKNEMNMDEDEYARMVQGERRGCPYYKRGDEYFIVRKQM